MYSSFSKTRNEIFNNIILIKKTLIHYLKTHSYIPELINTKNRNICTLFITVNFPLFYKHTFWNNSSCLNSLNN